MANVLNLQTGAVEVTEETKKSTHGSWFWCRHSTKSVVIC